MRPGDPAGDNLSIAFSTNLLPLRLAGPAFLIAWGWCLHGEATTVLAGQATTLMATQFAVLAQAVTLVALALLAKRLGPISHHRSVLLCGAAAAFAGSCLVLACINGVIASIAANAIACLLVGFGEAVLLLVWAEAYGRMPSSQVFLLGGIALAAAAALYYVAARADAPISLACTACFPLLSYALCHLASGYVGAEKHVDYERVRYNIPWKPIAIMAVCGFTASFIDVTLFDQGTTPHIVADAFVGVLIVAGIVFAHRFKPEWLVALCFVCTAAGVACVAIAGWNAAWVAAALVMAGYVAISAFTFALLANISRRHDIPSLWLFGLAAAARTVSDHLGGLSGTFLPQLRDLASSPYNLAVVSTICLVMLGVVGWLWLGERSFSTDWDIRRIDVKTASPVLTDHETLLLGCEHLAIELSLTPREAEVLEMLLEGQTYQQISNALVLSFNTVKTHAAHAYAKLGVHSREEASALAMRAGRG